MIIKGEGQRIMEKKRMVTWGLTGRRNQDIAYLEKAIMEYGEDQEIVHWIRNILSAISWS